MGFIKHIWFEFELQYIHLWATQRGGRTWGRGWRRTFCSCPAAWRCGRAGPGSVWGGCGWPGAAAGRGAVRPQSDAPYQVLTSCCPSHPTESCLGEWREERGEDGDGTETEHTRDFNIGILKTEHQFYRFLSTRVWLFFVGFWKLKSYRRERESGEVLRQGYLLFWGERGSVGVWGGVQVALPGRSWGGWPRRWGGSPLPPGRCLPHCSAAPSGPAAAHCYLAPWTDPLPAGLIINQSIKQ